MTKFERWFLRRIFRNHIVQGPTHPQHIEDLYGMIRDACAEEFTEDNTVTLHLYLYERFETVMGFGRLFRESKS